MGATFGRVPDVGVLKSVQMKSGQMGADWGKLTAAFSGFTSASTVIRGRYAAASRVLGHWFIPPFVLITASDKDEHYPCPILSIVAIHSKCDERNLVSNCDPAIKWGLPLSYLKRTPTANAHKLTTVTNILLREFLAAALLSYNSAGLTSGCCDSYNISSSSCASGVWTRDKVPEG